MWLPLPERTQPIDMRQCHNDGRQTVLAFSCKTILNGLQYFFIRLTRGIGCGNRQKNNVTYALFVRKPVGFESFFRLMQKYQAVPAPDSSGSSVG